MKIRQDDLPNKKKPNKPWKWTPRKELAAQLLAHSSYCNTELAQRLGISRTTLYAWQQNPEFAERVGKNSNEFKEELKDRFFEEYAVPPNWREEMLKKVVHAMEDVHPVQLETLKSTPAALINLALRLQEAVDLKEKRTAQPPTVPGYKPMTDEELDAHFENQNRIMAESEARFDPTINPYAQFAGPNTETEHFHGTPKTVQFRSIPAKIDQ